MEKERKKNKDKPSNPVFMRVFRFVFIILYGQACATVHVETHGIGLAIYELTAIVRRYGVDKCEKPIEDRMEEYMHCLIKCEKDIATSEEKWAKFLLDDSKTVS